jgi:phenylalanyl-tRNA synthetase beta chain
VNLSDVYRGKPIEEGKKSVTINLLLRSMERTLRESEAVDLRTKIVKLAEEKFGAYMRDVN